jgi:hypothetical protein
MSDSKKILYFIKKFNISRFSKLSPDSKKMIKNLVNIMEEAVHNYSKNKLINSILDVSNKFPKGKNYSHVVEVIKQEFENQPKVGKQYSFSIGSRNFTIYLIKPTIGSQNTNTIYKMFDKTIYKIYIWLFICNHFASPMCSPDVTIYIYMTNHKKMLPEIDYKPLDKIHANTAFTFACPLTSNEIYVFRNEEWFKVLIHESFHCFGLDFALLPEEEAEKKMFSIFPISCNLRFYETYTEIWAEIINVIFISVNTYPYKEKTIDIHKLSKIIENHLYNEQVFSLFQCSKVLHHLGLKYRELYETTEHSTLLRNERYKENTHVFSYYILKCIIMFHYNDFIEWCIKYNGGSIQFTKTQENINRLFEFVKEKYNSPEYLRTIEIFENWFWLSKKGNKNGKMELETMRMSISE